MKYKELINKWINSKEEFKDYEWNAAVVAARVYKILRTKLDLENEKLFKLFDPDETKVDKIQKTMYSHVGATKLSENGWAKFGLFLLLERGQDTFPKEPFVMISYVRIVNNRVSLRITEESKPIDLNIEFTEEDENKIEQEYDKLFNLHIENSFRNWLNNDLGTDKLD